MAITCDSPDPCDGGLHAPRTCEQIARRARTEKKERKPPFFRRWFSGLRRIRQADQKSHRSVS